MSDEKLDLAHTVILTLGGFDAVARITGKHISRVYRWTYPKGRGGTGGYIPQPEAEKLLAHAKANRIRLSAADFFAAPALPAPTERAAS
jgi:hypothetical protein